MNWPFSHHLPRMPKQTALTLVCFWVPAQLAMAKELLSEPSVSSVEGGKLPTSPGAAGLMATTMKTQSFVELQGGWLFSSVGKLLDLDGAVHVQQFSDEQS